MKPAVYVENSVISYLAARRSRDLVAAARQEITWEWWENRRECFELLASELVYTEAAAGDAEAAERRLRCLKDVATVPVTEQSRALAGALLREGALPKKAAADALHVATAAVHGISYLLTWNCTHLANAEIIPLLRHVCQRHGFKCPEICTPEELMGEANDD